MQNKAAPRKRAARPLAWIVEAPRSAAAWPVVEFRSVSEERRPLLDHAAAAARLRSPLVAALGIVK